MNHTQKMIWAWPTRVFHWLLAIGFSVAFLSGEWDNIRNVHAAFGLMAGGVIVFRIIYGFVGPAYSRFSDFPMSLNRQIAYFKSLLQKPEPSTGHNPPASLVMTGILVAGILTAITGYLAYNQPASIRIDPEAAGELHEVMAGIFLGLVIAHLAGVAVDYMLHGRKSALPSIITGKKTTGDPEARLNTLHHSLGLLMIVFSLLLFAWAINQPPPVAGNGAESQTEAGSDHHESDETGENDD